MKQTLLILALFLQSFLAFTENITEKSSVADSLLIELRALPHDTTRLKLLEKLVLTEQNSPHYIEYAEEMFNEAQRQKNPKYICSSTYFKILYYYNKNEVDSVSKLVNYVKPIAKRMEFFRLYFNAQKLLIYTYTYKEKYEYAINESLKMLEKAEELKNRLSGFRVKLDATDNKPGWKFAEAEMRGIPVRVEIGPKDIEQNQVVVVRRDTREKIVVSLDEIETKLGEVLEQMQNDMLERAKKHLEEHTVEARNWDEFKAHIEKQDGFVKAMWCGETECEEAIKDETTATTRCMPFEQEHLSDVCVCCGKPAKKMVYWGRAY